MYRKVFGGVPDTFRLTCEFGPAAQDYFSASTPNPSTTVTHPVHQHVRLPVALATLDFEFNSEEDATAVVERFAQRKSALLLDRLEEHIVVRITELHLTPQSTQSTQSPQFPHGKHAPKKSFSLLDGGIADAARFSLEGIRAQVNHTSTDGTASEVLQASPQLRVSLLVSAAAPALRCLQVSRGSSTSSPSESVMAALMKHCDLTGVWKVKGAEGFGHFWTSSAEVTQWQSLRNLNLSYSGLTSLPHAIGALTTLRILRLSHNRLTVLPADVQHLSVLEVLAVDHNLLTAVPVELRRCSQLREINLDGNKLANCNLDLRNLLQLQSLQLHGNPLEYLPELSPCTLLRSLSLANVRILADSTYSRWEVEVGSISYMARGHKLTALFKLTFRRSSAQHPLVAGALGRIAEDRGNCELIAKEEVAIQQLLLMSLSEHPVVVQQACKTICHLAALDAATAKRLVSNDVLSAVSTLLKGASIDSQLCGLTVLASLAGGSDTVSTAMLSPGLLLLLQQLIQSSRQSLAFAALEALSNLAFAPQNKLKIRQASGLLQLVVNLAQQPETSRTGFRSAAEMASNSRPTPPPGALKWLTDGLEPCLVPSPTGPSGGTAVALGGTTGVKVVTHITPAVAAAAAAAAAADATAAAAAAKEQHELAGAVSTRRVVGSGPVTIRLLALRVLAVLGENEQVRIALQLPAITGRGVRVLSLDGGGMKGLAMVQVLRHIERVTGKPIHTLFDLIVGTSTGAIIAVSMGVLMYSLDQCEAIYTKLGQKVFNQQATPNSKEDQATASWRDSLYKAYKGTSQNLRAAVAAVYGSKHDPSTFQGLLKEMCNMPLFGCVTEQFIDTTSLGGPKVAVVSTRASICPAAPFIFRNYELNPEALQLGAAMKACPGSSKHLVWQAVRASSAAPYYLDEYVCGEDRFQDGAATANNPCIIAVQQARLLFPDQPLEVVVSLGVGIPPPDRRQEPTHRHMLTASVLIESACSVERVDEAMAALVPMIPGMSYFRFQTVDDRCAMELDDVDPSSWARLQAAVQEFCVANTARFEELGALLCPPIQFDPINASTDATDGDAALDKPQPESEDLGALRKDSIRLGSCQGVLLLEAPAMMSTHQPSLMEEVAEFVASLRTLKRRCNLVKAAPAAGWFTHCSRASAAAHTATASAPATLTAAPTAAAQDAETADVSPSTLTSNVAPCVGNPSPTPLVVISPTQPYLRLPSTRREPPQGGAWRSQSTGGSANAAHDSSGLGTATPLESRSETGSQPSVSRAPSHLSTFVPAVSTQPPQTTGPQASPSLESRVFFPAPSKLESASSLPPPLTIPDGPDPWILPPSRTPNKSFQRASMPQVNLSHQQQPDPTHWASLTTALPAAGPSGPSTTANQAVADGLAATSVSQPALSKSLGTLSASQRQGTSSTSIGNRMSGDGGTLSPTSPSFTGLQAAYNDSALQSSLLDYFFPSRRATVPPTPPTVQDTPSHHRISGTGSHSPTAPHMLATPAAALQAVARHPLVSHSAPLASNRLDHSDNNHLQAAITSHASAPQQQNRTSSAGASSAGPVAVSETLPTTPRQSHGSGIPVAPLPSSPDFSTSSPVVALPPSQPHPSLSLSGLPTTKTSTHTLRPALSLGSSSRDGEVAWGLPLSPDASASRAGGSNSGFGGGVWRMQSFGSGAMRELRNSAAANSEGPPVQSSWQRDGEEFSLSSSGRELSLAVALLPDLSPDTSTLIAEPVTGPSKPACHDTGSKDPHPSQQQGRQQTSASAGLRPFNVIHGMLKDLSGQLGVVHLALHSVEGAEGEAVGYAQPQVSDSSDILSKSSSINAVMCDSHARASAVASSCGGMVVGWHNQVVSLVEGSSESSELLLKLGHDPAETTLTQLFAQKGVVQAPGREGRFSLLSRTELSTPWGSPVTSLLLQQAVPSQVLSSDDVMTMMDDWGAVLVVSANPLPAAFVQCLLRCGVKSVVAPRIEVEYAPMIATMVAFFTVFYRSLFAGESVSNAISSAECAEPLSLGLVTHTCL